MTSFAKSIVPSKITCASQSLCLYLGKLRNLDPDIYSPGTATYHHVLPRNSHLATWSSRAWITMHHPQSISGKPLFFKIEVLLIYSVVLISTVQWSDMDIYLDIHSFLFSSPLWFIPRENHCEGHRRRQLGKHTKFHVRGESLLLTFSLRNFITQWLNAWALGPELSFLSIIFYLYDSEYVIQTHSASVSTLVKWG